MVMHGTLSYVKEIRYNLNISLDQQINISCHPIFGLTQNEQPTFTSINSKKTNSMTRVHLTVLTTLQQNTMAQ